MRNESPHGVSAGFEFGAESGVVGVRFEFNVLVEFSLVDVHA